MSLEYLQQMRNIWALQKVLAARCKWLARAAPKSPPLEALFHSVRDLLEKRPQRKRYFTAPETHFALDRANLKI
jgi:hypothetical protein